MHFTKRDIPLNRIMDLLEDIVGVAPFKFEIFDTYGDYVYVEASFVYPNEPFFCKSPKNIYKLELELTIFDIIGVKNENEHLNKNVLLKKYLYFMAYYLGEEYVEEFYKYYIKQLEHQIETAKGRPIELPKKKLFATKKGIIKRFLEKQDKYFEHDEEIESNFELQRMILNNLKENALIYLTKEGLIK